MGTSKPRKSPPHGTRHDWNKEPRTCLRNPTPLGHPSWGKPVNFIFVKENMKRPRSFSNGSHSIGGDNQSGEKGKISENTLQPTPASNGGESTSNDSVQNSEVSSKYNQIWGCDVLSTSACQAAESRLGLDNLEADTRVLKQKKDPHDKGFVPTPMEVSGTRELVSDVLSKMGQNVQESEDPLEVTSPRNQSKHMKLRENNRRIRAL
ncbi:hypothetical protein SO802_014473 [Lithocarpus litseifolius]|uniref:Uncharacterized protein n=1 Tax=Lithocarpus litseifolius TaxID=425828 RepID=A0AAW2CT79_9ROSI